MSKHTPTPWRAFDNAGATMQGYSQSSGITGEGEHRLQIVAGCFKDIGGDDVASANAAFIVKACNSHDALVAALKMFVWPYQEGCRLTEGERMEAARAALTAAGEGHE